ncbi:MAG: hypothetical protein ABIH92_01815 [Nanoarchaeota archaeon]
MEERKEITTIKLKKKTKNRLDKLRKHKRESYEEIVERILGLLNVLRSEPFEAQEKLFSLEKGDKTD